AMDVVVQSSRREAMAQTTLEAMAVGRPVVSTTTVGADEAIEDGVSGLLVPVGDAAALADAVVALAGDPARRAAPGGAARAHGGRGATLMEQLVWCEEYARAGAPDISTLFVGLNHAGPTLVACGTEEQKAAHLPPLLRGEVIWCQGFSEPNAGSDLASLQTRAVVEGDVLVVSGQKVWTSFAHVAQFQELLVRTDPEAPRHRGITWVICPMDAPGIEIRPITTLTGESDFCEVFYDHVKIPLRNVVGQLNDGWRVAMATLSFERGTAFLAEQVRLSRRVDELVALAQTTPGPRGRRRAIDGGEMARRLARACAEVDALRAMTYRSVSLAARTGVPGAEASMIRLFFSELV